MTLLNQLLNRLKGLNATFNQVIGKADKMTFLPTPKDRSIKLKGAFNFRDMGGYIASGGKTIAWGKLFRSDNLAGLTKNDLKRIETLNLKLVVDLRSQEERESRPNRLPASNGIQIKNIEIADVNKSHKDLTREIFYGKLGGADLAKDILMAYERAASEYLPELRLFFDLLLDPANYPFLVLCNAGKDRTGVVIALALTAIGVPKKTVVEDYLLSKVYLKPMVRRLTAKVRLLSLFRADIVQLKHLLDARVEYLNATLDAIDQKYGSAQSFLSAVGMDQERCKSLKTILCG